MATDQSTADHRNEQLQHGAGVRNGAALMALAGVAFVGYGVAFLVLNFVGSGFELGVSTLGGATRADLDPTVAYYLASSRV